MLVVMAKWPAYGRCKNRLAKTLGRKKAALLQARLLSHTLAVAKEIEEKGLIELRVSLTGIGTNHAKRWGELKGVGQISAQGKGCLGLRMRKQVIYAQKMFGTKITHTRPTILIGTDLPTLCRSDLINALDSLKKDEVVIGPSNDGGYWLIGLGSQFLAPVISWPFSGIPWGTNNVLAETLIKAKKEKAHITLLKNKNDIDTIEDLAPWKALTKQPV